MLGELLSDLHYRLRVIFRRAEVERELDDELRFHLDREAEKHRQAGLSPNDAFRRARLAFGGLEDAKEQSRDVRGTARLETLVQDARYAIRSLRQHRVFSLTVILTLALGIGANTAIFALIDALLLRSLPVPRADRLVTIGDPSSVTSRWTGSPTTDFVSYPLYSDVRERNHVLSGLYANGSIGDVDVVADSDPSAIPEHPETRLVSGNFFSVLELSAAAGRTFTMSDDDPAAPTPVAVVSFDYWQRRFGGERDAIGRVIRVNGVPITIVGVTPRGFAGDIVGVPTDMWLPIALQPRIKPRENLLTNREVSWLVLMGRLAPGIGLARARAELTALEPQAAREHLSGVHLQRFDEDLKASPIRVEPGERGFSPHRETYASALVVLFAAVGLVILVVCANVCNLMLARAVSRMREMTVRMTLGAGRRRLLQQLLTESLLLAGAAGFLGLVVALWGSKLLLALVHSDPPIALDIAPNGSVLAFTAAATLACVVLFALVPAFRVTRMDLATALRGQGRGLPGASPRTGRVPLARVLVVAQIALSLVLLIGSGLLLRSLRELLRTDLGMDREHLLLVHVATSRTGYAGGRLLAFERDLRERVRRLPGVDAASYSLGGPFSGGHSSGHVTIPGFVAQADSEGEVRYDYIGPDYFHALGAHLVRGRDFTDSDLNAKQKVAAIDLTMAKYYFRARDPIGRTVSLDSESYTIVGVVHDVQYSDVRGKPVRQLYIPDADSTERPRSFELQVHVRSEPNRFVEPLRQALMAADRTVPIEITSLTDRLRRSVAEDELLTQVTSFFGAIALVLAALGLYGVTAYSTTRRTAEFGLRAALGAEPWQVGAQVLREAIVVALGGILVGLPIGLLATRLLQRVLFGVRLIDGPSLGVAVATLTITAVIASYLPAWRASKVSPLDALRSGE